MVNSINSDIIAPGNSVELYLVFMPSITGDKTATLTISNNDPDENPLVLLINGRGEVAGSILVNGSFDNGTNGWGLTVLGSAQASGSVVNGEYHVAITNGGTNAWDVYVGQSGLLIENGKTYQVTFDAYGDATRTISPW